MSRTQQLAAIAAGIGMVLLFDHFHLISSGYETGRIEARLALLFGAGIVFLIWHFLFRKKGKPE